MDRRDANLALLAEADDLQQKTKDVTSRIKSTISETEDLGVQTLDQLRRQGNQLDDVKDELTKMDSNLDRAGELQKRMDFWAFNWSGGRKRAAMKEAAKEISEANKADHSKAREVFQDEYFDTFSQTWRPAAMVLCSDPTVRVDLFDPNATIPDARWKIDFPSTADAEGWWYSSSFSKMNERGHGRAEQKWSRSVRRRKWRLMDGGSYSNSAGVQAVRKRHEERIQNDRAKAAELKASASKSFNASDLQPSGLSSSSMVGRGRHDDDQALDEDSAAGLSKIQSQDKEIDADLDDISAAVSRLQTIAGAMNEESRDQNNKLKNIEESMQKTGEKQTVINARQRYINQDKATCVIS